MSHTYVPAQAHATKTAPAHAHAHVSPSNGLCHLTLGPHMLCLCVHVAHPNPLPLRRAPTISPTHGELYHGYPKLGQNIICPWFACHRHIHAPMGFCGGLHQCHPLRQSPFMDDVGSHTPLLYIKTG
ncbi:hypothetical protein O181_090202 [Austropuccinia psidii MF-1]|uniref:Uncharacterized protein n=1 Tax=Austropuccinia psidii MF-1 TaxID=1389203 RepID=A0A9Q3IV31_9BASI|nr:hypothetical protein [Austropuccinia psidii MF-1]